MEKFDVVIVGARCAGSATARLLAQGGMRVLLVDRATFPSDTVSTHSMAFHGSHLLQRWGLFERVVAAGTPNTHEATLRLGDIRLDRFPAPATSPGWIAPRRTVLDHMLAEDAQQCGATLWDNTTVSGVLGGERVAGVTVRRADGTSADVAADLVVGADGVFSRVARAVKAATLDERSSAMTGSYAYFSGTGLDHNRLVLADQRAVLVFPTNDDLACIAVGSHHDDDFAGTHDEAFAAAARTLTPEVADAIGAGRRETRYTVFKPQPSRVVTSHGPGWALVGDAGLYMDPVTGQGIGNAFLGAQLLADTVLSGHDLGEYQARRDELLQDMFEITAAVSRMEWTNDEVAGEFMRFRAAAEATLAEVSRLWTNDLPSTAHAARV
jgi:flavin-dependent dehydrogenase